ncbi:MAG: MtrB/PioB family outer membrane beta-barrel protein, partial [Vicinamibacterales bacterium]
MRSTACTALAAAMIVAAAATTGAQAPAAGEVTGVVDVGARATSGSGDEARYERYQDLRSGVFSRLVFGEATDRRIWSATAENVGYRNQAYDLRYATGAFTVRGAWDSTPTNFTYLSSTPWVETAPGVFSLSEAARLQVQGRTPGVVGVPATVAQLATPSIFRTTAAPFDLQLRRDTASASITAEPSSSVGWSLGFITTSRTGRQPYGASFSFNNANELAVPVDQRANDITAGLEYSADQGMVRLAWQQSWFTNQIQEILWDNPLRATDVTPFDASGYSNGNGAARGRMATAPDNHMSMISATGLYKLAPRTTLNGVFAFTSMGQNDTLIPWTSNGAIANSTVYAAYPGLASLPRQTAEAKVHGVNGLITLTTRPNRVFGLTTRYRFNDHRNLTPAFDATQYVRFDASPSNAGGATQNFNIRQNTFDTTASLNVRPASTLRLGYTYDDFNRTGRAFSDMHDFIVRASFDQMGSHWITMRLTADRTERVGSGFSEASLEDGGLQPGLRFYDESDRIRTRGSAIMVVTPGSAFDITATVSAGKDVYRGEGHEFGLLNNTNRSVNLGVNLSPNDQVSLGVSVGRELYNALQRSRNANPPGTDYGSWTDPNRTWDLTNDEHVTIVDAYLDLAKVVRGVDVRADYVYSDSDNAYVFSGPRITALSTNAILTPGDSRPCAAGLSSCFEQLPAVTNAWHRISIDGRRYLTAKVGIAVSFWYERFDVTDFARVDLPGTTLPQIDYLGG